MNDATILYLSSNQEKPEFEAETRRVLLEHSGDLPIVAVTQKPVDFGPRAYNIVVGDVGASGFNFCRQLLIGTRVVATKYLISAESDCLYPPEYFKVRPGDDLKPWRNRNVYVLKRREAYGCLKREGSTFAQVVETGVYKRRLEWLMNGMPEWDAGDLNFPKTKGRKFFDEFGYFETKDPCVSFKTGRGMRHHSHTDEIPVYSLPYWGSVADLKLNFNV